MGTLNFWLYKEMEARVAARAAEQGQSRNDWLRDLTRKITSVPKRQEDPPVQISMHFTDRAEVFRLQLIAREAGISASELMRRVIEEELARTMSYQNT